MCDAKINNELFVSRHTHNALLLWHAARQTIATTLHSVYCRVHGELGWLPTFSYNFAAFVLSKAVVRRGFYSSFQA